jgi:hypothetical protein
VAGVSTGREQVTGTPSGRQRETDVFSTDTVPDHNAVFEVKNESYVMNERRGQVSDLAHFAASQGAELWVFTRAGAQVAGTVSGIANVRIMAIPQQPLVVVTPRLDLPPKAGSAH